MPPVSIGALIISIITLIFSIGIMLAFIMVMYTVIMRTITSQGIRTTFDLIYNFCSGGTNSNTIYARASSKYT